MRYAREEPAFSTYARTRTYAHAFVRMHVDRQLESCASPHINLDTTLPLYLAHPSTSTSPISDTCPSCQHLQTRAQVPKKLCAGAQDARLLAEEILNNTVKATPPPSTPRPACVCTPQGCDCLGQFPRLRIEAGSSLRAMQWFWMLAAGATVGLVHWVFSC